jgi:hypothetical protein
VFRLSDSSNLCELVLIIHKEELVTIQNEIDGKKVSVVYDGTTHVCEALFRLVDDWWQIKQHLIQLMLLENSLTGEEVALN